MLSGQEVGGSEMSKDGLAGRFQLPFSFLFSSCGGDEDCCELFARRKRAMMEQGRKREGIDNLLARVMRVTRRRRRVGSARWIIM